MSNNIPCSACINNDMSANDPPCDTCFAYENFKNKYAEAVKVEVVIEDFGNVLVLDNVRGFREGDPVTVLVIKKDL